MTADVSFSVTLLNATPEQVDEFVSMLRRWSELLPADNPLLSVAAEATRHGDEESSCNTFDVYNTGSGWRWRHDCSSGHCLGRGDVDNPTKGVLGPLEEAGRARPRRLSYWSSSFRAATNSR